MPDGWYFGSGKRALVENSSSASMNARAFDGETAADALRTFAECLCLRDRDYFRARWRVAYGFSFWRIEGSSFWSDGKGDG